MPRLKTLHRRRERVRASNAGFKRAVREFAHMLGVPLTLITFELICADWTAEEVYEWLRPYLRRAVRDGVKR